MKKQVKNIALIASVIFILSFFVEALVNYSMYLEFSWFRAFSVAFAVTFVVGFYEYFKIK